MRSFMYFVQRTHKIKVENTILLQQLSTSRDSETKPIRTLTACDIDGWKILTI
jgi:hypothetical protein